MTSHLTPAFRALLPVLIAAACTAEPAPDPDDAPAAGPPAAAAPAAAAERGTLDEARAMLDRAADHYERVGREQALRDFTAQAEGFVDRDLYVFCYGPDRTVSAHAFDAAQVGNQVDELRDVDGTALGTLIMTVAEADPAGGLAEYKWTNPVTGAIEPKVSVVRKVGTDVCGVGAYRP